jgi:hypothetical protein
MTIGPRGASVTIKQTGATLWSSAVVAQNKKENMR